MRKTALITGASKGLGKVIATYLAGAGFELVLTARGADALERTIEELTKGGRNVTGVVGDVGDAAHREQLADLVADGLDVLVNNASSLGPSPQPQLVDYPLETLESVYGTNVLAPIGLVQSLLPALETRDGLIVNISSDAAVGGYEGWGGYGSSKAALDLVSKTLGAELAERGVASVAVDPGDMRTDMHQAAFPGEDISDRPLPNVTIPFWAWLFAADHASITGQRFQAQAEAWEVAS